MSKHTPGPWVIQETNFAQQKNVYAQADKPPIATVYGSTGENEANARLIAAAPEMLEALRNLLDETMHATHDCPVLFARRVIAKATGNQP